MQFENNKEAQIGQKKKLSEDTISGMAANESYGLRPSYPHEQLDEKIKYSQIEYTRAARAKEFLNKHPEFSEFLTLFREGIL